VEACPDQITCIVGVTTVIVDTTRITVYPEKRIELSQTVARLLDQIKDVKGCRTFRFYLDASDKNSSLLVSEWETESDYLTYLSSNDFAILKGAIKVLSVRGADTKALVPIGVIPSRQPWLHRQNNPEAVRAGRSEEV
jgi:quinol monooxygenase YgiN